MAAPAAAAVASAVSASIRSCPDESSVSVGSCAVADAVTTVGDGDDCDAVAGRGLVLRILMSRGSSSPVESLRMMKVARVPGQPANARTCFEKS